MPGHIFFRVGHYAEAEKWFAASMAVDERYMREQQVAPDDDWNYVHNMMYAIANLMEQGKLKEANALSDHLAAARGRLSATLYVWSARDQMARISRRLPVALRVGDWDSVLAMLQQAGLGEGAKTANLRFLAAELGDFATGMKALDGNDVAAAQAASERMDAGLWRIDHPDAGKDLAKTGDTGKKDQLEKDEKLLVSVLPDAESGPLVKCLSVASLELRAGVLAEQGKLQDAKELYASAAREEKKLGYHEPPFYIRPVGEKEATSMLRAKDFAAARAAYETALAERPASGFGLYGLALTRELSGDPTGAREAYKAFIEAWPEADASLPEVMHARKALGDVAVAAR